MPKNARIYILISAFLGLLILLTIVYLVGLARGRTDIDNAVATAQAQAFLARIIATDTPTATPSPTDTPTITPTPTHTPTPTASPTSSPTPASPEEWANRFLTLATSGLNAIAGWEFTAARAESLLRSAAQQQSLVFTPVAYAPLASDPWSALLVLHTPDGKTLPMLFWQDPNDGNRIRSQLLLSIFTGQGIQDYSALRAGIQQGAFAADDQGRFHALLIERAEGSAELPVWLLAQSAPAADFALVWSTREDPNWPASAQDSTVLLNPHEGNFLPDLVVDAPLPPAGSLRTVVRAPGTFVEQDPFARQWTNTRWTHLRAGDDGAPVGYELAGAGLRSTPLTSMAQIIALLQSGKLDSALNYATRLDLIQQAFGFGLAQPGWWMGLYLSDSGEVADPSAITPRLRFFDNGDRVRTFDATFELDESGFYRLAALQQAAPIEIALVTPAAPLPTLAATTEPSPTPSATPAPTQDATTTGAPATVPAATPSGGSALSALPTNTPLPTPLPAGQPTATPPATATATPEPPRSPTATPTRTATPPPTETATPLPSDTPTATPLPIPSIPAGAVAPLTGVTNVLEPARLRGGPGTDYPVLLPVGNGLAVGLFGITESGEWLLIRVDEPGHPNNGFVGWMFRDLVASDGDYALLPRYGSDGIALTPPAPAEGAPAEGAPAEGAPEQSAPLLPTSTPTPLPSPTATPLQTPEVRAPDVAQPAQASVPPPEAGEFMATVAGDTLPAHPLAPIPAIAADGREFSLRIATAETQIWGGLLGSVDAQWLPAAGEMLWPGAILYVTPRTAIPATGTASDAASDTADSALIAGAPVEARRVRIVGAPPLTRVALADGVAFASAAASADAVGLVGGANAGVSVLDTAGGVTALWPDADAARWLDAGEAGVVAPLRGGAFGRHGFLWTRTDGAALRIYAQPWFAIAGVAGDPYTGLWWIETPLAPTGRWQLWQWDPQRARVLLRLEAGDDLFSRGDAVLSDAIAQPDPNAQPDPAASADPGADPGASSSEGPGIAPHLLPTLVAMRALTPGDPSHVALYVTTTDALRQTPNQGFFRLELRDAVGEDGAPTGAGAEIVGAPQLLLPPNAYQQPLVPSPDQSRLAFLAYDSDQPSLTAGIVTPANRVKRLTLYGEAAGSVTTIYQTETPLEFLAPLLTWQDAGTLLAARARFAAGGVNQIDMFGAVWLEVGTDAAVATGAGAISVRIPAGRQMQDIAGCRLEQSALLVLLNADGSLDYARWASIEPITPTFTVPNNLRRVFTCWRNPPGR